MADDIVYFLLDGKKVSNDPRWLAEQYAPQLSDTVDDPDLEGFASEGVEEEGYASWTAKQLKAEVKARKEDGREIDTTGVTTKVALATVLDADDVAQAEEAEAEAAAEAAAKADAGDNE